MLNPKAEAGDRVERLERRTSAADAVVIGALAALLILPYFALVYMDNWGSIECTFIAHARFLAEHWPLPGWQPLWYGGTRFDYVYPPALNYGTALIHLASGVPLPHAYHLYVAFFYALGIAGVYVFVRTLSGSRGSAWVAATATALVSPSFWLLDPIRADAANRFLAPQRLNALVFWGEGPHVTALALIPFAIAFSYSALTKGGRKQTVLASVFCSLVVANNFYGGVSLGLFYGLLLWSLWVAGTSRPFWGRAVAIPALAYGLDAWWLTPSYLRVTVDNLKTVEASGNPTHLIWAGVIGCVFLALSFYLCRRRPERLYGSFVGGLALIYGLIVLTYYWFDWRVVGSPPRFVPELDLALILALTLVAGRIAQALPAFPGRRWTIGAVAAALLVWLASTYLPNAWRIYPEDPHPEQRVEYRISSWVAEHHPDWRWFVDGSKRLWFDVWFDDTQFSGGSDQGLLNRAIVAPFWQLRMGDQAAPAILWMQAFGVDGIIVHDETSADMYGGYDFPKKFEGELAVLFDEIQGETIYEVPRRFRSLARVVDRESVEKLQPIGAQDLPALRAYVGVVEDGPDTGALFEWLSQREARISAYLDRGRASAGSRKLRSGMARLLRKCVVEHALRRAGPNAHRCPGGLSGSASGI